MFELVVRNAKTNEPELHHDPNAVKFSAIGVVIQQSPESSVFYPWTSVLQWEAHPNTTYSILRAGT